MVLRSPGHSAGKAAAKGAPIALSRAALPDWVIFPRSLALIGTPEAPQQTDEFTGL
jgi:hypothetical protein